MTPSLLPSLAICLALAGCVTAPPVNANGSSEVRLGQSVNLGGPKVTPIRVLEDSRCPIETDCFWAGRVRLEVKVELGSGVSVQELASDKPLAIADGTLELLGTMPPRNAKHAIEPGDYRFALKFSGGL
ncbi:MAG TPA: hypothetical protein PKN09_08005 [Novosphingobium sp.]|nr:hypothetical protein [Novosphingobium sp.]